MKALHRSLVCLAFLSCTIGCASTFQVIYRSDPPGAMLHGSGRQFGYTPVRLEYNATEEFPKGGCSILDPIMVRWASGAEASVQGLRACKSAGYEQEFVFIRPTGVPGREFDVQFALERERIGVMKKQALFQLFNAINQQNQSTVTQKPVNCSTQVIGNNIYTRCE